jgi:hypothetical protein
MENEQPPMRRRRPSSRSASTSLFLGVVAVISASVLIGGIIGVVAIFLGVKAQREITDSNEALRGRGMAHAGRILGILAIIVCAITFPSRIRPRHRVFPVTFPTTQLEPENPATGRASTTARAVESSPASRP